jgi:hypothetical protein
MKNEEEETTNTNNCFPSFFISPVNARCMNKAGRKKTAPLHFANE